MVCGKEIDDEKDKGKLRGKPIYFGRSFPVCSFPLSFASPGLFFFHTTFPLPFLSPSFSFKRKGKEKGEERKRKTMKEK